jgi:hypothetical protein
VLGGNPEGLKTETGCPIDNFGHDRQVELICHSITRISISQLVQQRPCGLLTHIWPFKYSFQGGAEKMSDKGSNSISKAEVAHESEAAKKSLKKGMS